jgi:hypothetical protein
MSSLLLRRSKAVTTRLGGASISSAFRLGCARSINVFCDYSWAVEPLEKKGLKLRFDRSPEDEACVKTLDTPSKRVEVLVGEILALDVIEYAQFMTRFEVSTILRINDRMLSSLIFI